MATPEDKLSAALQRVLHALRALAGADPKHRQEALDKALMIIDEAHEASVAEDRLEKKQHVEGPERRGRHHPEKGIVDLSVLVATNLPCTWPLFVPPLIVMRYVPPGPGPYASQVLVIDEHTGTHWDAPNHFIPPPSSGLPNAAPPGAVPSQEIPVWQFVGEACVIDVHDLQIGPKPGESALITSERVQEWEQSYRNLGPGDVVLFRSGYSDAFYKPFPEGRRFSADALDLFHPTAPGWPAPSPECVEYLARRGVRALGTDSPNIGPVGDLAPPVHVAGEKYGLIWTEVLTNLDHLPTTGAFYAVLGAKHANGSGGEARALAITHGPAVSLLLNAARQQRVVDLTVLMREDLPVTWPGRRAGGQHVPYLAKTLHTWDQFGPPAFVRTHVLDSQTGTHLVPPPGFDRDTYDADTRSALERFEQRYGILKPTEITAEQVSLDRLIGHARVIDVKHRIGTSVADPNNPQPRSPVIRVSDVEEYEDRYGRIQPGEIVLFHSGHSDRFYQPLPHGEYCLTLPLVGLSEGWPAPDADTILFLAEKRGVRCIGTDGPSMGSADPVEAMWTYWAGGSREVCFVEYLTNLGQLPPKGAYFLFGPVKIQGSHGGHGRALALFLPQACPPNDKENTTKP